MLSVVLVGLCAGSAWSAPLLSAGDFLPVAQAPEEQRKELSGVQNPGAVHEELNPVLKRNVVKAATAQDAINYIVQRCHKDRGDGCEAIGMPDGKLGLVAVGTGTYDKDMRNLTALRRSQRLAYMQAFMDAKAQMARYFNGASTEGLALFTQNSDGSDTEADGASSEKTEIKISNKSTAAAVLKGYVTYSVYDDFDNSTVYVALVSTPKTQGRFSSSGGDTLRAENLSEGLNAVMAEIQNGVVPPVGGRIVTVPQTGEIAFVGFGSAVIRSNERAAIRASQQRRARKIAELRAASALCGIITGESVKTDMSEGESQSQSYDDFNETIKLNDPIDDLVTEEEKAELKILTTEYRARDDFHEVIETAHKGTLPPGVTQRAWLDSDGAFAYGVAVYVPSVTNAAAAVGQDIQNSQILKPVEPSKARPAPKKEETSEKKESSDKDGKKDKAAQKEDAFKPGVSGTIVQDL